MKKIPLIYILSSGRSGSTLLDILLGLHTDIWTMGEVQILPIEIREDRQPCGCGESVLRCDFWSPILAETSLNQDNYPIDYFREQHTGGKAVRLAHIFDMLFLQKPSNSHQTGTLQYATANHQCLSTIKQRATAYRKAEISWLVDSSKDVYRLFWLNSSNLFDIRVIFLTKDPRAFVYSMTKNNQQDYTKMLRMAIRWQIENTLFQFLCKHIMSENGFLHVRYEDLALKPGETISKIGSLLELDFTDIDLNSFKEYENHAIAGNPMRHDQKRNKIILDEKWRTQQPVINQRIISMLCGKFANQLGYKMS